MRRLKTLHRVGRSGPVGEASSMLKDHRTTADPNPVDGDTHVASDRPSTGEPRGGSLFSWLRVAEGRRISDE